VITTLGEPALPGAAGLGQTIAAVGELWTAGVAIDWRAFNDGRRRRRVSLPTYPFERTRHWVEPTQATTSTTQSAPPKAKPMDAPSAPQAPGPDHAAVRTSVRTLFTDLSGFAPEHFDDDKPLIELGLDSLVLTQAIGALRKRFSITLKMPQLMGDLETITAIAAHVARHAPPERLPMTSAPTLPATAPATTASASAPTTSAAPTPSPPASGDVAALVAQNLQLMARQLDLLQHALLGGASARPDVAGTATPCPASEAAPQPTQTLARRQSAEAPASARAHTVYRPPQRTAGAADITPEMKVALADFIDRYTSKTAKSKELTARHRSHLADPRSVAGFRAIWKEMIYPIVVERSEAGRVWDIDGNEHVDLVNGFGSNFFGHGAGFIRDAIEQQLARGMEIGPQSPRAGDIADRFCRIVGAERAAYCNTGSEAVVAAIRTARTVTGRDKIVMFDGAYHGIFDEVLVRPAVRDGKPAALPIAPGIPRDVTNNVIVLDYGDDAALDIIEAHGDDIAAVLVEPVQSRRPELRPREFLHKLRDITAKAGTALVFDEVVTGFRVANGGMQAVFDVDADIATYGKVIGGGLPIGIIAGSARFLDALDGGHWTYGDDSMPEAGVTFFAGTFVRHPLALAAADAVLARFEADGGALQRDLNRKTMAFVERLNAIAEEAGVPVRLNHFSSWFMVDLPRNAPLASLFYAYMRHHGVQIWEGRPGFLTLGHTDDDLDRVAEAFARTVDEMAAVGFLPSTRSQPPVTGARLGRDALGRKAWFVPDPDRTGKYLQIETAEGVS
jgi:glutamate-1-semialdehyde aminotransferase/acyl carrier protein